jgi:hypothetical protein
MKITAPQLKRLQVLYAQYASHALGLTNSREDRLRFASERIGRKIASFSDLTLDEGIKLIDGIQRALGVALPSKTPRRRKSQRDALNAGTHGRHDQATSETVLVGDSDIRRIQRQLDRLGWTQARLEAFLASPRGPNARRTQIRTLADANRVYWALKHITPRPAKPGEPVSLEEAQIEERTSLQPANAP